MRRKIKWDGTVARDGSTEIHIYVVGAQGVGKSTLVERAADLLGALGVTQIYTVTRDPKRPLVAHARTLEWSAARGHRNVRPNRDMESPRREDEN